MKVSCAIFAIKMPRKSISSFSKRAIALTVLSRLLYAISDRSFGFDEIRNIHQQILKQSLTENELASASDDFAIADIPWNRLLDSVAGNNACLRDLIRSGDFSVHEIRYMCAMMCGLTGKEYGLITGFRSHYNLSWSIRQKLALPSGATNLRNYLQKLSEKRPS